MWVKLEVKGDSKLAQLHHVFKVHEECGWQEDQEILFL